MAAIKPRRSKLNSVAEARASPAITGIRDRFTHIPVFSPRRHLAIRTVNIGAELFIVSVNDTAT